jgi:hypothetical protein
MEVADTGRAKSCAFLGIYPNPPSAKGLATLWIIETEIAGLISQFRPRFSRELSAAIEFSSPNQALIDSFFSH